MPAPARSRNGAATKDAILNSACRAFTQAGYDHVGVREIAEAAGVTAMMVNRYFGSKEQLYADVVARAIAQPAILTNQAMSDANDAGGFGRRVAQNLISTTRPGKAPIEAFLILMRSASNPRAVQTWRNEIDRQFHGSLTHRLAGPGAAERAALVFAVIAGFQMMRQIVGLAALADADEPTLCARLAALFDALVVAEPDANHTDFAG